MFDLFRSRDKAVRILLGGILVVVSLSMLTYLIPNYSAGSSDPSDQVVAEVGKDTVTVPEVTAAIQRTMRGRQIPPAILSSYIPQMVDELVMAKALAYQAQQLGMNVTDAELTDTIRQMIPGLFPDGKFAGADAYAAMLSQDNLTIAEFESNLRMQMLSSRLREVALQGIVVTSAEIEREYRRKNEKIKVAWVKLSPEKYKSEAVAGEDEVQAYFKANTARYQIPEERDLSILYASPAKLEETLVPADADLARLYEQDKESFRTPERVRVRHILLKTTDKPAADEPKIKAKAEDLLKQIKAGGSFADLAKKNSEDETSAKNAKSPGELPDWVVRGQTVPEFEKVAFTLKPGQTSDLVKTQYGYHIIQVVAHEDAHLQTLQEAKNDLTAKWKKQRVNDIMQNASDKAQQALQKGAAEPEKVAEAFHMQLMRVAGYRAGQPLPSLGSSSDFDQAVAPLKVGEVSSAVGFTDNQIAVALATGVKPAHPATFVEVQNQVRETVTQNRLTALMQKKAQDLMSAARGSDLAKAAKAAGLEVKTSDEFSRSGSVDGLGPASYLEDAFSKPDGSVVGPVSVSDGTVIAQVTQHIAADLAQLAAQHDTIRDEVKNQKARDQETLFNQGVREELIRRGKLKVHPAVIQRLINSYGSSS